MKVGILGSGDVAQALGRGFAAKGHDVKLGTRDPKKLEVWKKDAGPTASVGGVADAARFGELVVLAVLGTAAEDVVKAAGPNSLDGKVVIDTTNPLDFSKGMPPGSFLGLDDSLAERVQKLAPKAKVVKAFNTVPNVKMCDPGVPGARMMVAGNDAAAKKKVEGLLKDFKWAGVHDLGGIENARWLEAFVPLWVRVGVANDRWDHFLDVKN